MNKKYLIYKHENKINGKVYIGCTCRTINSRAGKKGNNYQSNKKFWEDIKKFGWENFEHSVLYDNIQTIKEASELESKMIEKYKSFRPEFGYNKQSSSNAIIACKNTKSKKVYQYDLNGNYITEWNSMNQAALYTNCDSSQISRSCRNHNQQAGGYLWRTEKYNILQDNTYKKRQACNSNRPKTIFPLKKKPIFCFDDNFNFIKIYETFREIKNDGINSVMVKYILRNGSCESYNNMKWSRSICPTRICLKR